ncbi:MAG: GntR family transcriptional regulator [Rhodocyclaceae bacterium]|nr:GntR family transcriptional regulator [Rhodocyclaceae bacterium]
MNARAPDGFSDSLALPALFERVAEKLRARIYAHELAPGAWIDEQALAEEFGISRTPLREALKVLAAEGLVVLKPRRGCYVAELSERDIDEIFSVLAMLEGRAAEEATRRATAADLARLAAIQTELETHATPTSADRFFEINQVFHDTLKELAGNRWLAHLIDDSRKFLKLTRRDSLRLAGRIQASASEHAGILAAIAAHDPALANQRMQAHILSGRAAVAQLKTP